MDYDCAAQSGVETDRYFGTEFEPDFRLAECELDIEAPNLSSSETFHLFFEESKCWTRRFEPHTFIEYSSYHGSDDLRVTLINLCDRKDDIVGRMLSDIVARHPALGPLAITDHKPWSRPASEVSESPVWTDTVGHDTYVKWGFLTLWDQPPAVRAAFDATWQKPPARYWRQDCIVRLDLPAAADHRVVLSAMSDHALTREPDAAMFGWRYQPAPADDGTASLYLQFVHHCPDRFRMAGDMATAAAGIAEVRVWPQALLPGPDTIDARNQDMWRD